MEVGCLEICYLNKTNEHLPQLSEKIEKILLILHIERLAGCFFDRYLSWSGFINAENLHKYLSTKTADTPL